MATPTQVPTKGNESLLAIDLHRGLAPGLPCTVRNRWTSGPIRILKNVKKPSVEIFFLSLFLCLLPTVPQEPDPFYYDYDTVQTVGMTLATILFLLGILIIISKKVKCRKAGSSPTCKSCKSELPSSAPGGGGV
ncbi:FXYD domain-containing ion transport regulator 7 isoform X2 [Hippopotamus amphibius kiboko]|uniref:FXYD domain-containing ion transport regulator 7 isoform X2 n=1 Tax=Hippopotamus amphibius kiboko TaxID=575201 RepID=UPI002592C150|nr:FXYD domain-containing ion transport regulator 7 isoform X2 [Hippopotamus amphibius kiboko]